jgi:hypothetical protein
VYHEYDSIEDFAIDTMGNIIATTSSGELLKSSNDGTLLISHQLKERAYNSICLDSANNVYVNNGSGVSAYTMDGVELWSSENLGHSVIIGPILGKNGMLICGLSNGEIVALGTEGRVID